MAIYFNKKVIALGDDFKLQYEVNKPSQGSALPITSGAVWNGLKDLEDKSLKWKGEWILGTAYLENDVVIYNQNLYLVKRKLTASTAPNLDSASYRFMFTLDTSTKVDKQYGNQTIVNSASGLGMRKGDFSISLENNKLLLKHAYNDRESDVQVSSGQVILKATENEDEGTLIITPTRFVAHSGDIEFVIVDGEAILSNTLNNKQYNIFDYLEKIDNKLDNVITPQLYYELTGEEWSE